MENTLEQKEHTIREHLEAVKKAYKLGCSPKNFHNLQDWLLTEQEYYDVIRQENELINELLGSDDNLDFDQLFFAALSEKSKVEFAEYLLFSRVFDLKNIRELTAPSVLELLVINLFTQEGKKLSPRSIFRLFELDYQINTSDVVFVNSMYKDLESKSDVKQYVWCILLLAVRLNNTIEFRYAANHENLRVFLTILSFKMKSPFGTAMNSLSAIANNALEYYKGREEIILKSMKTYDVYQQIIEDDAKKKGAFQKKLNKYRDKKPEQDLKFEKLVHRLLPELQ